MSQKNECNYFYDTLPTITFEIDKIKYPVDPSGYLLSNYNGYKCVVGVGVTYQDELTQIVLG